MNLKVVRMVGWLAIVVFGGAAALHAEAPAKEDAALAAKLIKATEKSDHASFIADGEAAFRQLQKEQFDGVAAMLAPKLRAGYELSYLGELKQRGYRVTLWKLTFKNGSDDALATLSTKNGKVGGFFIR